MKSKEQKRQEAIARAASYFESDRQFSPRKRFDSLEEYLDLFRTESELSNSFERQRRSPRA